MRLDNVTVTGLEVCPVSPRVRPDLVVHGARGTHDRSDFLLVRVTTSAGVEGVGEVSGTLTWSGEDATTATHVLTTALGPAVLGRPLVPVSAADDRMDLALAGHSFTKAAVSMALWDAYARLLDVPLAVALGGPVRTEVSIKCSLSGDGDRLATVLAAARAAGFTAYKVKIGLGVEADVARVRLARDLVGPNTFLGLDANGGYRRSQAAEAAALLASTDPAFLEQPLPPGDWDGMRALRSSGVPLVADEGVFSMSDLKAMVRAEAGDAVSLYIGKSGGPGRAMAMGAYAEASGIDVIIGSNGELGVGAAAQLHVACALRGLSEAIPSDIIGAHYYDEDVIDAGPESDGTTVRLPDAPGLGVRLSEQVRDDFRPVA